MAMYDGVTKEMQVGSCGVSFDGGAPYDACVAVTQQVMGGVWQHAHSHNHTIHNAIQSQDKQ